MGIPSDVRYLALAADYDGTLATDGRVDDDTLKALRELRSSGRTLIMVTGRRLDDLETFFPEMDLFDRIVAENGAVLFRPRTKEVELLGDAPDPSFVEALRTKGVEDIDVGHVIVATWTPHESTVLETIRDMGLGLQVIFNKGAVMVLPQSVTKATGLQAALDELGISPLNVAGVGDAENDHAFLVMSGCAAAVSNALPAVKETCDITLEGARGAGVAELARAMIRDDLATLTRDLRRHDVLLGSAGDEAIAFRPGDNLLVAGPSGSGKSTLVTAMLERCVEHGLQVCIVDPEGDYDELPFAVALGTADRAPAIAEIVDLLRDPSRSIAVNLLGVALEDRPGFFAELLPHVLEQRAATDRPHLLVVDEAHHMLPADWEPVRTTLPSGVRGMVFITVHPEWVSPTALGVVDVAVSVGPDAATTFGGLCKVSGRAMPGGVPDDMKPGEALVWRVASDEAPARIPVERPHAERLRHRRKYAEGSLAEEMSFYFTGPEGKLRLRAQNLTLFAQLAEGVDDETWQHHLARGDYSRWLRHQIKDPDLADAVEAIEAEAKDPRSSRDAILSEIKSRYTASTGPSGTIG